MALLTGFNIANVERVKIETEETTPVTYVFETASSCACAPAVSAGQEVEQRIKNVIMGLIKTDDVLKGYDITLEDQRLIVEVLALIDGGTITTGTNDAFTKYEGPNAGSSPTRKAFTMTLYTSDRDTSGDANSYYAWKFTHCKGKPVELGSKDNEFRTTSYTIESRPASGNPMVELTPVASLPSVT